MTIYQLFQFICSLRYITFKFHQSLLNVFLNLQKFSLLSLSRQSAIIDSLNIAFDLLPKVIDKFGNMRTFVLFVFMVVNEANGTNNCFAVNTVYIQYLLFMELTNTGSSIDRLTTVTLIYV